MPYKIAKTAKGYRVSSPTYGTLRKTGWTPSTQKPATEDSARKSAMRRASR